MERLQLLILSQDSNLVGLVRAALQDLSVAGCYFDTDSTRALEVLRSRHFDGIILDCNDLACAQEILTRIRRGSSNRQTPVIAIVNGATDRRAIQDSGANFNVCKPVSPATIKGQLNKAFDAMQREHRRYFRYSVSLPLFVGTEKEALTSARLTDRAMRPAVPGCRIPQSPCTNGDEFARGCGEPAKCSDGPHLPQFNSYPRPAR